MGLKSFINTDEAHRKLAGTIISIKGKPAWVFQVSPNNVVSWCRLPDFPHIQQDFIPEGEEAEQESRKKPSKLKFNTTDFNLDPLPLGYVNFNRPFNKGCYVVGAYRIPVRSARVGINERNVGWTVKAGNWSMFYTQNMEDCMMGKYPSLMEALDRAGRNGICAFSRRFAVSNSGLYHIYYDVPVGNHMGGRLNLATEFQYLGESLAEDI